MSGGEEQLLAFDHARRSDPPDTLAPDGSEIRLLVAHSTASMCEVRLPPGGVSGPVRHRTVQEIWYFLAGEGEVWRQSSDSMARVVTGTPGPSLTVPRVCRVRI